MTLNFTIDIKAKIEVFISSCDGINGMNIPSFAFKKTRKSRKYDTTLFIY